MEPRTNSQIVADLLQVAIDSQWSDESNTSCSCHPEYTPCCPECGELAYPHVPFGSPRVEGVHKPDCKRMALIRETQAFLRAENLLAEERGEEGVYVS